MVDDRVNRPTVEDLIIKAESVKLDRDGVRAAFEHPSAPKFVDKTSSWLPESEAVHDRLLDALDPYLANGGRVLDLGAGTGRLTRLVLDRFPECSVVAADYSETMRAVAAESLTEYGDRVSLIEFDMFDTPWRSEYFDLSNFDAVVSGFAIHHGRTFDEYKSLYQRICDSLRPGGLFINLDHVAGESRGQTLSNAESWRDFLDEAGNIESDKFILGSYAEDTPISIPEHAKALGESGFENFEAPWQQMIFAVYQAVKLS
jgi:tRNA (cmo5U34)-methyltransferase